jgi:hypothetical protein
MTSLRAAPSTEFDERVGQVVGVPIVLISAFFANDKINFQQSL